MLALALHVSIGFPSESHKLTPVHYQHAQSEGLA